ncbi:ornithine decarboxylase antizyme-domain-containing protein [Amylostereum chailletii]|nr:ornithine decarboxylase antizyme-domain-containing protein [Amylostereum chailletii]
MSNSTMLNFTKPISSPCPANGRHTVGDGAFHTDANPSVLAVCHVQGADDIYYYSTTFSGGPGVRSSVCVRDRSAPAIATSPYSQSGPKTSSSPYARHTIYPTTPPAPKNGTSFPFPSGSFARSSPQPIRKPVKPVPETLSTPPLTPDSDDEESPVTHKNDDALELLAALFPRDGVKALSYAKRVTISSPQMGASFDGVVLDLPGSPRTLYVDGKSAELVSLRESIVALLDLADERLECSALIIALEKASPSLGELLHSLMYVGGTVVTKPQFQADPAYVLVGLEI